MLDVMRVSNNIITDLRSPIYARLCLHLISPNDNIKGYDVQSKKLKLLTSWTWKYDIPKIIASTTYLTSYTDDVNGRWHANISQYSGINKIKALCIYLLRQWNVYYLTWCNSYQYFRCTLVTLKKTSVWGQMMTHIFQLPYASVAVKKLKLLNTDWHYLLLPSAFLDRKRVQNHSTMKIFSSNLGVGKAGVEERFD